MNSMVHVAQVMPKYLNFIAYHCCLIIAKISTTHWKTRITLKIYVLYKANHLKFLESELECLTCFEENLPAIGIGRPRMDV